MGAPALSEAIVEQWADRHWRLNNLYYIQDKLGEVVLFRLNEAQQSLLEDLHFLNIVLKARQMGFSTFILILALDCCLFNSNFAAGLVADTIDNAKGLLKRIKFAYDKLPEEIKAAVPIRTDNALEVVFSNESGIEVGVSLRSGTKNFIHVSEYGKICAKSPDKAKEIKSGTLNTIAPRQLVFIESTAEGRAGDFYDKSQQARAMRDAKRELGDLDYRFHFFPWWRDKTYQAGSEHLITEDDAKYFDELKTEYGVTLTLPQKWWYAAKRVEQGDDMWKEYPSTPDEAFKAARDGAYFAKEMRALRQLGKIGTFPFVPGIAVDTFWDFGLGDTQTIWLHQVVAGENRFVGYFEDSGMGLGHYFNWLERWRSPRNATWGQHYAPHDVDHRRQTATSGQAETIKTMAAGLGYTFETVERNPDKVNSIQSIRTKLPGCAFDEAGCSKGIIHLESYSRDWDEKLGVWRNHPRHDEHSNGADAFMVFSDGYRPVTRLPDLPEPEEDWIV